MIKYTVILKSGKTFEAETIDAEPIEGLWIWMCRQPGVKHLNFKNNVVIAKEIASLERMLDYYEQ